MITIGANVNMELEPSQSSDVATEISNLMDSAVSVVREKELVKKTKAREAKIRRQVKNMEKGNPENASQGEDGEGGTKWFRGGEIGIMISHLENNYTYLFGNCKKADYKQQHVKAWQKLMEELNVWHEQSETNIVRDIEGVKRKIDNLKQRGKNRYSEVFV